MSKMDIQEIEARIEMTTERLQDLAEKLNDLEFRGYDEKDSEYMDIAIEARMLIRYKSELLSALKQYQENPASTSLSNPPFDSNSPDKATTNTPIMTKN